MQAFVSFFHNLVMKDSENRLKLVLCHYIKIMARDAVFKKKTLWKLRLGVGDIQIWMDNAVEYIEPEREEKSSGNTSQSAKGSYRNAACLEAVQRNLRLVPTDNRDLMLSKDGVTWYLSVFREAEPCEQAFK